jgi:hypothetical protein
MKFIAIAARRFVTIAAVGAIVFQPIGGVLAMGTVTQGTIKGAGDSVTLGSVQCGFSVLLKATATTKFQFWVQAKKGPASVENSNLWTGGGQKAVLVDGCIAAVGGYIVAVGVSGKFPVFVSSQDEGGPAIPVNSRNGGL